MLRQPGLLYGREGGFRGKGDALKSSQVPHHTRGLVGPTQLGLHHPAPCNRVWPGNWHHAIQPEFHQGEAAMVMKGKKAEDSRGYKGGKEKRKQETMGAFREGKEELRGWGG